MTMEIKIIESTVQQSISALTKTAEAFKVANHKQIAGKNKVNLVAQLNDINSAYIEVIAQYQTELVKHIQVAKDSIDILVETDQELGANIHLNKGFK